MELPKGARGWRGGEEVGRRWGGGGVEVGCLFVCLFGGEKIKKIKCDLFHLI